MAKKKQNVPQLTIEEIDCIQKFMLRATMNGQEAATFIVCQKKLGDLRAFLVEDQTDAASSDT